MVEIKDKENEQFLKNKITDYYLRYLNRQPDKSGLDYYRSEIKNNHLTLDDLQRVFTSSEEYKINQRLNHACIYTVYGTKMYLDPTDTVVSKSLNSNLIWEKEESEFFKNIIKEGMNVVDIGANIGYFTLLFSKWIGNKGKVYSFEPDPSNFEILSKNICANRSKNVTAFQKALSNNDGKLSLFLCEKNKGDHRIFDFYAFEDDDKRKKIDVESVTLDSVLSDKKIEVIKMDVQGAEYLVLEGMKETINKNSNLYLLTEFWPYAIEKSGHSPKDFIEVLRKMKFEISIIKNNKIISLESDPLIEDYEIDEFYTLICKKSSLQKN